MASDESRRRNKVQNKSARACVFEKQRMDALRASSSNSDSHPPLNTKSCYSSGHQESHRLPPPPLALLDPPISIDHLHIGKGSRIRSFPHVEGNYALHVFIPEAMLPQPDEEMDMTLGLENVKSVGELLVDRCKHGSGSLNLSMLLLVKVLSEDSGDSRVHIPSTTRKQLALFLKKVTSLMLGLYVVDVDLSLNDLCKDDLKLEQVALGREFHISLGRTVPIRAHQIDSIVTMLRQKLQSQRQFSIDFSKWEVFVNDDRTRSFLSMEVIAGGLAEITKQIHTVNEIYRLHNLPEFYKDPRPHVSLAWALGDISHSLKRVVQELNRDSINGGSSQKSIFTIKFSGIKCKIGNRPYKICKFPEGSS
ncbi:hypothetical protein HHK36_000436 [Tetracentron sinense]|uniref:U6 snRNA phosphodiesterase n=1 Tax=Tetracentron sinense TaxID=13715 RepID=A0A835DU03_TETSI|nr:hypothetical protein HHK36_000436 [Tetracentron sinense]